MSDLPTPLLTEILSMLPVKSLLRFRCVSKSWKSLIDCPYFIKLHLTHSKKTTRNHTLILQSNTVLYSTNFLTLNQPTKVNSPLIGDDFKTAIVGLCNGLLCLLNEEQELSTIIYNPATRQQRTVPVSSIDIPFPKQYLLFGLPERLAYGFGYDQLSDDYMLIRIAQFRPLLDDRYYSEVKAYSVNTGSWKRVVDFSNKYVLHMSRAIGVFVNGCFHWVMTSQKSEEERVVMFVAFDLGKEEWKVVERPTNLVGEFWMAVGVLGECLSMVCNYPSVCSEVWVMKEYGAVESWTRLFMVSQGVITGSFDCLRPIAYSMDRSKVLIEQDSEKLFWFDLGTQRAEGVEICGVPSPFVTELLVESLIPIDSHENKKPKRKSSSTGFVGSIVVLAELP